VQTTWVPAVLRTRCGSYILACGAHGNSKGTDNRAIVAITTVLAREYDYDVVLGMDANSNNVCKPKDVAHGAASREEFNKFVDLVGLRSCFPTGGDDERSKHTVRKERTYLQMQLKKAERLDQSLKDWVVSDFSFRRSVRVNNFDGPAAWTEDDGKIWLEADCMPNSHCPSDHCMLISRLKCPGLDCGDPEAARVSAAPAGGCCNIA